MLKAVILIGGPSKGTRFRPLSLNKPKPLFPVAGLPVVQHHIDACSRLGLQHSTEGHKYSVKEVILLGYYNDEEILPFIEKTNDMYPELKISYLREPDALGTAGGLYHFRKEILESSEGQVQAFFVMNGDVCSDFPLEEMLIMHVNNMLDQQVLITVMATKTTNDQSVQYGCMVVDKETNIIQHYVEKPSTFVSNTVNCGVYLCSPLLFNTMADIYLELSINNINSNQQYSSISNNDQQSSKKSDAVVMWMEQDVLRRLAGGSRSGYSSNNGNTEIDGDGRTQIETIGHGVALACSTRNWWSQLKTAGAAIYANRHYLQFRHYYKRFSQDDSLYQLKLTHSKTVYSTINHVYVHPTAEVHHTALLGPNVSIGYGVRIAEGVRIKESIVLEKAVIGQHSLVMHSIIGSGAKVGSWCRVEGSTTCSDPDPNVAFAKMTPQLPLFNALDGRLNPSITILGDGVNVDSEIVLLNIIVLPFKTLTRSYKNEIIL